MNGIHSFLLTALKCPLLSLQSSQYQLVLHEELCTFPTVCMDGFYMVLRKKLYLAKQY